MQQDQLGEGVPGEFDGEERAVHFGLGWGKPTLMRDLPGSDRVVSHGGATGTRIWIDPDVGSGHRVLHQPVVGRSRAGDGGNRRRLRGHGARPPNRPARGSRPRPSRTPEVVRGISSGVALDLPDQPRLDSRAVLDSQLVAGRTFEQIEAVLGPEVGDPVRLQLDDDRCHDGA